MSLKEKAVSSVKWTTLSTVLITIAQFFQLLVLARILSPEDFGLLAMVLIVIGFAQNFSDMGISAAIIYRQDATREQLSSLYWLNVMTGLAIFLLIWLAIPLIVLFFNEPRLADILQILILIVLITPIGMQFQMLLQKELRFNLLAIQEVSSSVVVAFVAITCALSGFGVWSLVWGQLTGTVFGTLILLFIGLRRWPPKLYFRLKDLRGYISFGLYQMGERSIHFLNYRFDQLLVGNLLGVQALGYYSFAFNLVIQPIFRINPILTKVAFPVFSKVQDDKTILRFGYIKLLKFVTLINAPLLLGFSVVAPLLIPIIFGPQWVPVIFLSQVMAIYALIRSTINPVGSLLLAKGRADMGFYWSLGLLITTAPFIYIGAITGGYLGIAIALLCLQFFYSFTNYKVLIKPLIGDCFLPYISSIIMPIFFAFIMSIGVWLIIQVGSSTFSWLIVEIIIGAILYIGFMWLFNKDTINEIRSMLLPKHSSGNDGHI